MTRCRTFRYRLYPTTKQTAALERLLATQCELYNAALEERRGAWRWERRSVSYVDQCRTLTQLRSVRLDVGEWGVVVCRGTLKRLDRAFAAIYRRCGLGQTPGFPRFKARARFGSVQWEDSSGWRVDESGRRLHLNGIGAVKLHLHRFIRGTPKAVTVRREGRHWWVSLRSVDVPARALPATGKAVGVDLGVGVLVATSDGGIVEGTRPARAAEREVARAQRRVTSKQRGSNRRRKAVASLAATHRRIANRRRDALHKVSAALVANHDLIVHESLVITNMKRRPKPRPDGTGAYEPNGGVAKAGLNRSIHDAGWGTLLAMIAYKAEEAGRSIIAVDPRNTSRRCSNCGHTDAGNRRGALFACGACGHQEHADVNAAKNILRAGRAQQHLAA